MRKTIFKLLVAVLLIVSLVGAVTACDDLLGGVGCKVTVMDGEQVAHEFTLKTGEKVGVDASALAKTGYEMVGIYTDAEMTKPLGEDLLIKEDMTLYVKYRAKTLYLIVDNGTGDEESVSVTYGMPYELTAPEREGYRFLNYSYMGQEFPLSGTYTYTNSIPVVAKWEKIVYINVFDGNSNTKVEVNKDGSFSLPDVADTQDKIFMGYLNGNQPFGEFNSESEKWEGVYNGKDDVYVVYNWSVIPTYVLSVNGLDGYVPASYKNGAAYALPTAPVREGYYFLGYTMNGEAFAAEGTYEWSEGITVTANWKRIAKIFVYNGANLVETVTVAKDGSYKLTDGASNDDYTFEGFLKDGAAFAAEGIYNGESDLIVMQSYKAVPTYTLTVNGLDSYVPASYKNGAAYALPTAPVREGYYFLGYTMNGEAFAAEGTYEWSEDITVTANWKAKIYLTVFDELTNKTLGKVEVVDGEYDLSAFLPENETVDGADTVYTYLGFYVGEVKLDTVGEYDGASETVRIKWNGVDRIYINVVSKGASYTFGATEIKNGAYTALATPTLDGYYFLGFFTDEALTEAFANDGVYGGASDLTVYAGWKKIAKIFVYNGANLVETVTVAKDGSYKLTDGASNDDYTFEGFLKDGAAFAAEGIYNGESDLIVMQSYKAVPTYMLVVNGLDGYVPVSYKTGAAYALPKAPTRAGYRFVGYFMNGEAFAAEGTYEWSEDITVSASWSEIYYVTVYDGDNQIGKYEVSEDGTVVLPDVDDVAGKLFDGYVAAGVTVNGNTLSGVEFSTTANVVWYILPSVGFNTAGGVLPEGALNVQSIVNGANALPVPTRDGYVFGGWKLGDELITEADGIYTFSKDSCASGSFLQLTAVWTLADTAVGEVEGKDYFKENGEGDEIVYVFLVGTTYKFDGYTLAVSNSQVAALGENADSFVAKKPGSFKLTITAKDGSVREVSCKVEARVTGFNSNRNPNADNFAAGISGVVSAGRVNIIPDIAISGYKSGVVSALSVLDIPIEYYVEVKDGDAYIKTMDYEIIDGALYAGESLIGKEIRVTVAPSYALKADNQSVSFNYLINDGVNVYTSDELYAAFKNLDVTTINFLREIVAEINVEQAYNGDTRYLVNSYENGVYVRFPKGEETVTINGNCYKLDASDIPLLDPDNGGLYKDGAEWSASSPYKYVNVHCGIITYNADKHGASKTSNSTLVINGLYIQGNFDGNPNRVTTAIGETNDSYLGILTGSQSANGIELNQAHLVMNNSKVGHSNVSVHAWSDCRNGGTVDGKVVPADPTKLYTSVTLKSSQIDDSFAHSIYSWGQVGITVEDSFVGQSSGAAFHCDDSPIVSGNPYSGFISFVGESRVENYVTGNDAWFIAFGVSPVVGALKSGLGGMGINIVKSVGGLECFNFISISQAAPSFNALDPTVDYEQSADIMNAMGMTGKRIAFYPVFNNGDMIMPMGSAGIPMLGDKPVFYLTYPDMAPYSILLEVVG